MDEGSNQRSEREMKKQKTQEAVLHLHEGLSPGPLHREPLTTQLPGVSAGPRVLHPALETNRQGLSWPMTACVGWKMVEQELEGGKLIQGTTPADPRLGDSETLLA